MEQTKKLLSKYGRHIILTIFFFFYNYTYSMINISFNFLVNNFYGKNESIIHNRLILLSFTAALGIFGTLLSIFNVKSVLLSHFVGIITLITAPIMLFIFKSNNKFIFLFSMYTLMFILGIECVYYYKLMSIAFMNMSHTGIVYTISMSCSILLQYLLQTNINNDNLVLYSLLLITFAAAFMNLSGAVRNLNDNIQEDFFNSKSPGKRQFITVFTAMLFIIVLFEYIGNFLSYPLLSLIFEGTPLVYDTPRLFIIISYIVMGVFADLKDMRYIPVITLTGVLIGILNPVLMHDGSSMYVNTCIYYVNAGIINSFFTLIMFKLARGQRHAPLIAVSGRIIDSFFSFVFISPIILKIPVVYTVGIELVCIIIIMLLLSFTGQLSFEQNKQYAVQHISPADFSKRFGLSNKESEVFLTAINFDGTMSELAKSMFMSRSVLYRNISNICDKTGCDSFQEVKRLYYELPSEDISPVDNESSLDESNTVDTTNDFTDKISRFANKYSLTDSEMQTLKIFLENPFKKQKELADMQDITLRTVQRHLANIKAKTNSQSLDEISELFYSKTNFNL